jgi:hypothetical protein
MSPLSKNAWIGYLIALGAVILICVSARIALAEGPPKEVLDNAEAIEQNQKIISETREAHERFMEAKLDTERREKQNNGLGWRMEWSTLRPVPVAKGSVSQASVDLDKLSKAVAVAETSGCTDGTARGRNNCHGIMCWPKTGRTPCYFASKAASHAEFKRVWVKPSLPYHGRMPDINLAHIYTGNDHPDTWLCNVHRSYYDIQIPDCHAYLQKTYPQQYEQAFL